MKRKVLSLAVILVFAAMVIPSQAANNASFTQNMPNYTAIFTPDSNDGDGNDWVCVVCYDSAGQPTDVDTYYAAPSAGEQTWNDTCHSTLGTGTDPVSAAFGDPDSVRPTSNDNNSENVAWCIEAAGGGADPDPDGDGDGVPDADDACPTVYGVGSDGCPLAPPDMDGDSIPDVNDACPLVPGLASNNGCPIPVPGCDITTKMTPDAVVGAFLSDVTLYWAPEAGKQTYPPVTMAAGKTAYVLGMDASGEFYKVVWGCKYLWAPVEAMGPNYDQVWQGWPLPTTVVN